jgi:hypothetical protein
MAPSLLSPGNLPSVSNLRECVYKIYTTQRDAEAIKCSGAYAQLSALLPVDFRYIEKLDDGKDVISSDCYREAVSEAAAKHAAVFTAVPDVVFADGGLTSITRLLSQGKKAILIMGLRAVKESLVPELHARFQRGGCICIQPRKLAELACRHVHPITECHMYDGDTKDFHPSVLCWRVKDEGFLLHSFHLHPVAICPPPGIRFSRTIDDDLMQAAAFSDEDIYVLSNSDEFLCIELSDRSYSFSMLPREQSIEELVVWMSYSTSRCHRHNLLTVIRVAAGDTSGPEWSQAERRASEVVSRILEAFKAFERSWFRRAAWALLKRLVAAKHWATANVDVGELSRARSPASLLTAVSALTLLGVFRLGRAIHRMCGRPLSPWLVRLR